MARSDLWVSVSILWAYCGVRITLGAELDLLLVGGRDKAVVPDLEVVVQLIRDLHFVSSIFRYLYLHINSRLRKHKSTF